MKYRSRRAYLATAIATCAGLAGCSSNRSDNNPKVSREALPPGTDLSGFSERDRLFEAHESVLQGTSFRYEESYDPIMIEPAFEAVGRQTAGGLSGSRIFELTASLEIQNSDRGYQMDGQRQTVCWRSEMMDSQQEYRRIETDVTVSDETQYTEQSEFAQQYPPGEQTTYERGERSLLREHRRVFVENLTLRNLSISPTEEYTEGDASGVEFSVTGPAPESPKADSFDATGTVAIDTSGLVRSLSVEIGATDEDARTAVDTTFSSIGTADVGSRPDWVAAHFDTQ